MKIALIGKTNVGKSTLFNLLLRKKTAITSNIHSTTVDFQEGKISINNNLIDIIDTGGYDSNNIDFFNHSSQVLKKVNLILFIVSTEGITSDDLDCLNYIRKLSVPIVMVINKCEKNSYIDSDFYKLGIKDIICTSCKSNYGISILKNKIIDSLSLKKNDKINDDVNEETNIKLSIVGRPNAGKSTFLNAILQDNRVVVSDKAGTTRDSISIDYQYKGIKFKITDTAGLRKKRQDDFLENISVKETFKAIDNSDICILMLDAQKYIEVQDVKIMSYIAKAQKTPIVLFNKWDLIKDKKTEEKYIRKMLEHNLSGVNELKYFFISSLKLKKNILSEVIKTYKQLNIKISTSKLNQWLKYAQEYKKPPIINKKSLKLKYVTQVSVNPLKFLIFTSQANINQNYLSYLRNSLSKYFNIQGVRVIIETKTSQNPYV